MTIAKLGLYDKLFQKKVLQDNGKVQKLYKKRWETSALNPNQELPQNTTEFNQKIQSSTKKMSDEQRHLAAPFENLRRYCCSFWELTGPNKCDIFSSAEKTYNFPTGNDLADNFP